jgi:methylenetetrahydrofolate dehydrogenase (NADP+)/methenyltetrahydrofolate cyclohydrolase
LATLKILDFVFTQIEETSDFKIWLSTKNIVLIGKGSTAGKPLRAYFDEKGIQVTLIDSKTPDPKAICVNADIIISSVGRQHIITEDMIKSGVIVISIGITRGPDGKLHGDYETNEILDKSAFYTPTPGGVGPVNVAMLLENLVISAENT